MVGHMEGKEKLRPSPDYLMQLLNDKKLMSSLPNFCGIFQHLDRLLDEGETAPPICLSVSLSAFLTVFSTLWLSVSVCLPLLIRLIVSLSAYLSDLTV